MDIFQKLDIQNQIWFDIQFRKVKISKLGLECEVCVVNGKAGKIVMEESILTFREAFCSVAGGI